MPRAGHVLTGSRASTGPNCGQPPAPTRGVLLVLLALVVFTAIARYVPHPFNVTPVGALALVAGAYAPARLAWLVPIAALAVGDTVNGWFHLGVMASVYVAFAASAEIGRVLLARKRSAARLAGAIGLGALNFYIITNFAVWLAGYYPPTLLGLWDCYVRGLPYLMNTLYGDVLYTLVFVGIVEYSLRRRVA